VGKSILIVEDEDILREKYSAYAQALFPIVHAAKNLFEARQMFSLHSIHCLLTDNMLPDGRGIDLVAGLRREGSQIPIIVITAFSEKEIAIQSVNLGVSFFIEKPTDKKTLDEYLRRSFEQIQEEEKNRHIINRASVLAHTKEKLSSLGLTEREIEIVECLFILETNHEIGAKLYISPGTVKNHLANIFSKLSLGSKQEIKRLVEEFNSNTESN
jgi:DNA-binding NarL/FixJ family response regulator